MTEPVRIVLAGAGRFAEEITDIAADLGIHVAAWVEGLDPGRADRHHRPPILWVDDQAAFEPALPLVPAIGSTKRRAFIERLVADGRPLLTIVHPSAVVASTALLGAGCVVFPLVVIGARASVGSGTIVNRGALIGHHAVIGMHAFVGPGANVAGGVTVGDGAHIGLGAIVRDDCTIGAGAIVGAGAVVVGDVAPGITVIGLPARPMERS